jgi:hypothetical protein
MWRGQLGQLYAADRNYRAHLLAMACLAAAKGPGGDPLELCEFCRRWQLPMTAPDVGQVAQVALLLKKVGAVAGGLPLAVAAIDPTRAINNGIRILGRIAPLLATIQMEGAMLFALDQKYVPMNDQRTVLAILKGAVHPQILAVKFLTAQQQAQSTWDATLAMALQMEEIRVELGLPGAI